MSAPRPTLLVLAALMPSFVACASTVDDDAGVQDASADVEADADPCPTSLCCEGKVCPGANYLCTPGNTCVLDVCVGDECCEDRPCADSGQDCVQGACVTRPTIGNTCTNDLDCTGDGGQCLFAGEGWPDGYCIQNCLDGDVCPGDGVCVGSTCFDGCLDVTQCRAGYDCIDVPGGKSCSPE